MADSAAAVRDRPGDITKGDFLKLVTSSAAAIGGGAIAWSLIDSTDRSADVLVPSSIEMDLAPIAVGSGVTVRWQGKQIFVRRGPVQEAKPAEDVRLADPIEPQADADRVKPGHADWIVRIGICTHLGCVAIGNNPSNLRGDWGGWFCPCHGSPYDAAERVRTDPPRPVWACRPTVSPARTRP